MARPRLLDLFCGAGGAGAGYARAGFDVVGVDLAPQPRYPFDFVRADALTYLRDHGADFDAIHASPPCQSYSGHVSSRSSRWSGTRGKDEPQLIEPTRDILDRIGRPYVIENVVGARDHLRAPLLLCGAMFGLPIPRHRLFEATVLILAPDHPRCSGIGRRYAELRGWNPRDVSVTGKGRHAGTTAKWMEVMDWPDGHLATQHELREAIPPAFTDWIGRQLIRAVE